MRALLVLVATGMSGVYSGAGVAEQDLGDADVRCRTGVAYASEDFTLKTLLLCPGLSPLSQG